MKKKRTFWTDKKGNKLTLKEFLKRWGEGMQGITPLQQTSMQLKATWIVITGIIFGLVVTSMSKIYWLSLILFGTLILSSISMLNIWQKYKQQDKIDKAQKEMLGIKIKKKKNNPLIVISGILFWIMFFTGALKEITWLVALSYFWVILIIMIKIRMWKKENKK